jgi:predicted transcriptional regulator
VKKTSLYLDPDVDRALDRLAAAEGITKAEIVRRALEREVQRAPRPRIRAIGVGAGPGDVADNVDDHLRQTGFGTA